MSGRKKRMKQIERVFGRGPQLATAGAEATMASPLTIFEDESYYEHVSEPVRPSNIDERLSGSEFVTRALEIGRQVLHAVVNLAVQATGQVKARRATRRLVLRESISLGERRFVAIVKVDDQEFLLGGAHNAVSVLAQMNGQSFSKTLQQQCEADRNPA